MRWPQLREHILDTTARVGDLLRALPDGGQPLERVSWSVAETGAHLCAYAYGTSKFALVRRDFSSASCADGPNAGSGGTWWHSEEVFCTANGIDPVCSPDGVWSDGKPPGNPGPKPVTSRGCNAYGNIGARAAYGSGSAVPVHPLGFVPAGQGMALRYVTRNRLWVMAKWNSGSLTAGIEWAFFPRSCIR